MFYASGTNLMTAWVPGTCS